MYSFLDLFHDECGGFPQQFFQVRLKRIHLKRDLLFREVVAVP
jgi:hypothetical protein